MQRNTYKQPRLQCERSLVADTNGAWGKGVRRFKVCHLSSTVLEDVIKIRFRVSFVSFSVVVGRFHSQIIRSVLGICLLFRARVGGLSYVVLHWYACENGSIIYETGNLLLFLLFPFFLLLFLYLFLSPCLSFFLWENGGIYYVLKYLIRVWYQNDLFNRKG